MIRRAVPYTLLPLSLIACALASAPWLRAFPSGVMAVPLFGAALLSVLTPLIVVGIGGRRLWLTALVDVAMFVFFELLVTLRAPGGIVSLYTGLLHGPSQILTFALPLVSPRTLLVAPVALCWISGAVIGECVARAWQSVLPYAALLVTFGLSYAGTARAVTSSTDGRRYDTLLAGALLLALLLLRAAQAWVIQDQDAEMTQPDGVLPMRGLAIGATLSVLIALAAAGFVQSSSFSGHPVAPGRTLPLDESQPLTPIAFVSGLRPSDPRSTGDPLFTVKTDSSSSSYFAIASVDFYDGDSWSFSRTFRPSGGVIPADADPALRPHGKPVTQTYTILPGPMTTAPWMPFLERPQRVSDESVNIDAESGMIVPTHSLHADEHYTVRSAVPGKTFGELSNSAALGSSAPPVDTALANGLAVPLSTLVTSLSLETKTPSSQPIAFLQAVARDFHDSYALAGGPSSASGSSSPSPSPSPSPSSSPKRSHPASSGPSTPASASGANPSLGTHTGGTTFADVLASIRASRSATPEQYATLTALIARELRVPARIVTGFRVVPPNGATTLPAGAYTVTSAEAWTWVEIPIRGQGWVVLDPSPGTYSGKTPVEPEGTSSAQSPTPTPTGTAQLVNQNPSAGSAGVAPPSKIPHAKSHSITTVVLVVIVIVIALLVLFVVFLLGRKRVRARRRRRTGDPRHRLLGAWQESLDVLQESGLPDLTHLTSAEVATATGERFGNDSAAQARYIGDAANLAIFSPTSWVGADEAAAAWRAQIVLSKAVRRRLGWRDRIGAGLRYHRTRRLKPLIGPTSWAAAMADRRTAAARRGRHSTPTRRARVRQRVTAKQTTNRQTPKRH